MLWADADFFLEQLHEIFQTFMSDAGQALTGEGLEAVCQVQQLGLEMIEAKALVIVFPRFRFRVLWVIQRAAHATGDVKSARNAEHAKGIETVGVLHDFRFEGTWGCLLYTSPSPRDS